MTANPDPGEYKGLLVLADLRAGEIIRREVNIELLPVEKAVDEIDLTATRGHIFKQNLHIPNLPLKPPGPGERLNLPENGTHIGIVYSEGHIGHVYVNGEPDKSQNGVVLLPIRIEGLDAVGTYSGKLNLAGTGDDEGAIPVKVKVTDHILWAILFILGGVLIPVFFLLWPQRWRPNNDLKNRRSKLTTRYNEAGCKLTIPVTIWGLLSKLAGRDKKPADHDSELKKAGEENNKSSSSNSCKYTPNCGAIGTYLADFDKARKNYKHANWFFDTNDEDYKKLIKTLETADDDLQRYEERKDFKKSIDDLKTALDNFAKFLEEEFPVARPPAFLKSAYDLLKGGKLAVGVATTIKTKAEEYVDLIRTWKDMAAQIKRYRLWGYKLLEKDMPAGDREVLQRAIAKVFEAQNEMLDAKDAATLADLSSAKDLSDAYAQLAYLGSRYGVWEQPEEEKSREQRDEEFMIMAFLDVTIAPEVAASIERAIRWLGDAGVIGLALFIAVLTGLTQPYFGKTFGTFGDYCAMILLGATTQMALKGLTDTLEKLRKPL